MQEENLKQRKKKDEEDDQMLMMNPFVSLSRKIDSDVVLFELMMNDGFILMMKSSSLN